MTRARRCTLLLLVAAAAAASLARAAPAVPPRARVEPVTDVHFGVKVTDPYRWMENPKDPEWLPWLQGQHRYTRSVLDALPGRAALLRRIEALSGDVTVVRRVQQAGESLFVARRPAGAQGFQLLVRGADGAERVLVDPTRTKVDGSHESLDWWEASPEGAHVVYGLSRAGSEASVLHVMQVATGEILPERIEKTDQATPSWLPDGSGFFYLQLTGERGTPQLYLDARVRLHLLRTDAASDPVVLERGKVPEIAIERQQTPLVMVSPGSDSVLAAVTETRPEVALWRAALEDVLAGRPRWTRVCGFEDVVTDFAQVGDALYLLSNRDHPRGRVLRTSARSPDLASAVEVLPEGGTVVKTLAAARDGVYATIMDGGVQRIVRIGLDGAVAPIRLPFDGAVLGVHADAAHDGAYLGLTSWLVPLAIWHVVAGDDRPVDAGLSPRPAIDTSPYRVERAFATAKDGVRIPYWVLSRGGVRRDGRNPTLATAYGAYGYALTPAFSPTLLAFLDAGGVYVVANVRGGGEYGLPWHLAGRKETKPNTWRDLIAVCEKLVADRVTRPAHLAITGTSAGGITVGRALTERPDLFAAAISNVGWSNPLRYVAEQNGYGEVAEWGSIDDERGFRGLLAMDSYQAIRAGARYPAVLCVTGVTDPRVAPFHVAKFAARLQASTRSDNPVLLRVDFDAGHGIGSTRAQSDALAADMYAFVLWRTGASAFQPRAHAAVQAAPGGAGPVTTAP